MKKVFKKIFVTMFLFFVLLFSEKTFSAGFNDYINNIKESTIKEEAIGACKNVCGSGYFQLKFGLPFRKMSRCSCVPINQGVSVLLLEIMQFLLSSVGVVAVVVLVIAGFMRAFSAGNAGVVKKTNTMIKNAFIGLITVIFSGSILAIINPNLVNTGIFSIDITKIDIKCVDDTKDKSDSTTDGYYTDPADNKRYKKNCDYTCVGYDCVQPTSTVCTCATGTGSQQLHMNMCTVSACASDSYCDVEGGTKEPTRVSGSCYKKLANGQNCVRGSDYSCSSGYCDHSGKCNNSAISGDSCSGDFGCWQYKGGSRLCISKKCIRTEDCRNSDFVCYNEFCVPEYDACFSGNIVKCGETRCNQDDPY